MDEQGISGERAPSADATAAVESVKRIQFWATLGLSLVAAGFAGAMYLNRYAEASDLDRLTQRVEAHAIAEEHRVSTLEIALARIEEDFHFISLQVQEVARGTRSRVLPAPNH